jgi:hypothetical protein
VPDGGGVGPGGLGPPADEILHPTVTASMRNTGMKLSLLLRNEHRISFYSEGSYREARFERCASVGMSDVIPFRTNSRIMFAIISPPVLANPFNMTSDAPLSERG